MEMRDYRRIYYYQDDMGRIWHGPFCEEDNLHYKQVDEKVVRYSDLPPFCVEITPWQAAQELKRMNVRPARTG